MIVKQAEEMRLGLIVNNKGQITDQAKFNEAMFALMNSKFKGGMEKQATTMAGLWSTITGTAKSAMAEMVGVAADGTIKQGSLFTVLKDAMGTVITKLNEWSANGSLQEIATKATVLVGNIVSRLTTLTKFIIDNKEVIATLVIGIGAYVAIMEALLIVQGIYNTYTKLQTMYTAAQTAANGSLTVSQWALNAALNANPVGLVVAGITALIAVGVLLYKNWDTIKLKALEFWEYLKGLWASINANPFAKFAIDILALANPITAIMRHFDKLKEAWNWVKDKTGFGKETTINTKSTTPVPKFRTGTDFVPNDTLAQLHYGERVLTKSENEQYSKGQTSSSPSINISINAVQELGNEIKSAIAPVVETAIKNYQNKQLLKLGIGGV